MFKIKLRSRFQTASRSKFFCLVCGILLALFATIALMSVVLPQKAYAQSVGDLVTLNVDTVSRAIDGPTAVKDASNLAAMQTARKQVIEILGQETYEKNKSAIEKKVVRQSTRFIPFVNPGNPEQLPNGLWKVPVELRVSQASLRKILLDEGLSGVTEAGTANAASILPLIAFTDRTKANSMRWWMGDTQNPDDKFLVSLQSILHAKLAEELPKHDLAFVKPTLDVQLPESLQIERPSSQDLSALGAHFKAGMLARGDVRVMASNAAGAATITVKIQVVQSTAPDRVIAEVVREFTGDPHAPSLEAGARNKAVSEFALLAKDLASQVQTAYQRGTVGTNFISLAVRGNLTPSEQTQFKTEFVRNVREVRDLKERFFESGAVTYEADYSGDAAAFANRLRGLKLAGFNLRVSGDGARTVVIDARASTQAN